MRGRLCTSAAGLLSAENLGFPSSLNCIYKLRTLPKGGVRFLCALPMQQNKRQNDKIQKTSEKLIKN